MFAYFESSSISTNDSTIQCLSWMGKVSNETNNKDKDWKCDRFLYYQDGWLATGGTNGIVGSTYTSTINSERLVIPPRTNFNLRGHKNEIKLVKWNEPYQKLASCDSKGVIYVWIKYEGRWSIELINDRGKIVSDFEWSHDGRMAAICYEDGFVLVGSVNGQRFWSHLFDLNNSSICSITWTPDDLLVLLGLSNGSIMVVDKNGTYVTRVNVSNQSIRQLMFNSHKFFMDEETTNIKLQSTNRKNINNNNYLLACCFECDDQLYILRTYDDVDPIIIKTDFNYNYPIKFEWSNCGNILAVGGCEKLLDLTIKSSIKFYNKFGVYIFKLEIPVVYEIFKAFCWGHNDERLFISTNKNIYISIVKKSIASCSLLAQLRVRSFIKDTKIIDDLNLPIKLKYDLKQTYKTTIRNNYPKSIEELRVFVCSNSKQNERLHCTMKRNIDDNNNDLYTLYLEYLGNLIPLLKAKKCSKIKPNFVIFDPNYTITSQEEELKRSMETTENELIAKSSSGYSSDTDDSDVMFYDSLCSSPKSKSKTLNSKKKKRKSIKEKNINTLVSNNEHKLVEINSNLWGTKFKFNGLNYLPLNIGSITYKTSLFHLQPRQMKIKIKDLSLYSSMLKDKKKLTINSKNCTPKLSYRRRFLSLSKPKVMNKRSNIVFKSISDEDCDDEDDDEQISKLNITEISSFENQFKNYATSSSNSEIEEKRNNNKNELGSNLIIYPLNDQKKQQNLSFKQKNLSSNNNVSTLSASNDLTKLQFISRPTSPANLIRPISPPAIQIKEPISSPRINTKNLLTLQSIKKNSTDDIRSVVSLNSSTILNADTNSCDNEVINYLKPTTTVNSANSSSSSYTAINELNEFEKFKSLISCLDPTTNDISNRVLLLNNNNVNEEEESKNRLSFSNPLLSTKTPTKQDSISLSPATSSNSSSSKSLKTVITSKSNNLNIKNEKLKSNTKVYSKDFNKSRKSVTSKESLKDKRKQRSKSENFENKKLIEEIIVNDIEYLMHNKPPIWNQANQVYQLDFGGRVTQESAKNFQIEYNGKQIMQFGRIDGNAYTLDFEWPFTVVQAFSIALANITQRLK